MESVRCLLADIPQILLADIVQHITEDTSGIEVIGRVNTIEEVPEIVLNDSVDVLILGMKSCMLPNVCLDIMNNISNLIIVCLVDDGRRLAVYLDNIGKNDILKVIKTFGKSNKEY